MKVTEIRVGIKQSRNVFFKIKWSIAKHEGQVNINTMFKLFNVILLQKIQIEK